MRTGIRSGLPPDVPDWRTLGAAEARHVRDDPLTYNWNLF